MNGVHSHPSPARAVSGFNPRTGLRCLVLLLLVVAGWFAPSIDRRGLGWVAALPAPQGLRGNSREKGTPQPSGAPNPLEAFEMGAAELYNAKTPARPIQGPGEGEDMKRVQAR